MLDAYSNLHQENPLNFPKDISSLELNLNAIIDIIRGRRSSDSGEHPRVAFADKILHSFRTWLDLPAEVYQSLIGEILFRFKGVKNPQNIFATLKATTRKFQF